MHVYVCFINCFTQLPLSELSRMFLPALSKKNPSAFAINVEFLGSESKENWCVFLPSIYWLTQSCIHVVGSLERAQSSRSLSYTSGKTYASLGSCFQTPVYICNLIDAVVQYISPLNNFLFWSKVNETKESTRFYQGTKANIKPHRHTFLKHGSTFVMIFFINSNLSNYALASQW